MKKSLIIIASIFVIGGLSAYGQVGIGTATPNSESILDLTNSGNKGLLLPTASSTPTGTTPEGLLKYYQGSIYLTQTGGVNVINPWKYKYNSSVETMTFNPSSIVGVGIGINTAGVQAILHISSDTLEVSKTGTSAAFMIGDSTTTTHMLFDADEIMVKTGPSTAGLLKFQEEDGSLKIGSDRVENVDSVVVHLNTTIGSVTNHKNVTLNGNIDVVKGKVKENGNELLPKGAIIMWSGNTIPAGWGLCDSTKYLEADGSDSIQSPDLRGRFIVSQGANGEHTYSVGASAGTDSLALVTANLPIHQHSGETGNDGAHSHTGNMHWNADNDDFDHVHMAISSHEVGFDGHPAGEIRANGSAHSHALTTNSCIGCATTALDIRPKYYALAFIIKL